MAAQTSKVRDVLSTEGCKVQTLTVSDQHATLLVTHSLIPDGGGPSAESDSADSKPADEGGEVEPPKAVQSLIKLTLVPFHKELLGSNPIISGEDRQTPERNLLLHDPKASDAMLRFLRCHEYAMKSESGAEYSYYTARPCDLPAIGGASDDGLTRGKDQIDAETRKKPRLDAVAGGSESSAPADTPEDPSGKENNSKVDLTKCIMAAASGSGAFDVELISPASARQITRAMPSLGHTLINETPEMYESIVRPYIKSVVDSGSLSWIANVVQVKKEKERLLVNHDDFIVNIDTKWRSHPDPLTTSRDEWRDHPSTCDLYCLGIVKISDIASLRDLRGAHRRLLEDMRSEGLAAIESVYGVACDQVRVFVHYQPQFYHFHVHFTRLENETGCAVERGHLLSDILQNLEGDGEYYAKRTITYKLKKGSALENLIASYLEEKI